MNMNRQGRNPDQDIIDLLGKMKDTGPEYPPRLWADRRAAVLASLAVLPVAAGLMAIPWIARLVKLIKAMTFIDKIILTVEVAAITGMTGYGAVTAYQYRYQLQQLLLPSTIHTPFPTLSVPPSQPPAAATNSAAETATAGTGTPTPTVTPFATLIVPPVYNTPQIGSTPLPPPTNPPPTNPPPKPTRTRGLHLGQTTTPKPPKP
jgi:hypothetical protein